MTSWQWRRTERVALQKDPTEIWGRSLWSLGTALRSKPRKYWTGLRTLNDEREKEPNGDLIHVGPGWQVVFEPIKEQSRALPKEFRKLSHRSSPAYELFILAPSLERADYVAALLFAAHTLVEGAPPGSPILPWDPY
jgi:hypothetical protein